MCEGERALYIEWCQRVKRESTLKSTKYYLTHIYKNSLMKFFVDYNEVCVRTKFTYFLKLQIASNISQNQMNYT